MSRQCRKNLRNNAIDCKTKALKPEKLGAFLRIPKTRISRFINSSGSSDLCEPKTFIRSTFFPTGYLPLTLWQSSRKPKAYPVRKCKKTSARWTFRKRFLFFRPKKAMRLLRTKRKWRILKIHARFFASDDLIEESAAALKQMKKSPGSRLNKAIL